MAIPEEDEVPVVAGELPKDVQDALDDLGDQAFVRRVRKDLLTELTKNTKALVDNPDHLSATMSLLKDMDHSSIARTRLKVDSAANKGAAAAAEAVGYLLKNLKPSMIPMAEVPADFKPPSLGDDVPKGTFTEDQLSTKDCAETFNEFQARVGAVAPGAKSEENQ